MLKPAFEHWWGRIAAAVSIAALFATTDAQQGPTFREGVTLVRVDLYPRRDGRIVEDLAPIDVEVFEDGRLQVVTQLELIRPPAASSETERLDPRNGSEALRQVADPRNRVFVLYLDPHHVALEGRQMARAAVVDFVRRVLGPADLFALASPELAASQLAFSRRGETIERDFDRLWPLEWAIENETGIVVPHTPAEQEVMAACLPRGKGLADGLVRLHREDLLIGTFENLMRYLSHVREDRKHVVFFSVGPTPGDSSGLVESIRGRPPVIAVGRGGRLGTAPPPRAPYSDQTACDDHLGRLAIDFPRRWRDLLPEARQANVSIHTVDIGGLKTDASAKGQIAMLRTLAEAMDGTAVVNTNDLSRGLQQVAASTSTYYLLTYTSSNNALDGKFRTIEVKVRRPGVSVTARPGYFAGMPAAPASAATATLPSAEVETALAALARLRADADLLLHGAASSTGIAVVAEIGSRAAGRWTTGADVAVTLTRSDGTSATGAGRLVAGSRSVRIVIPSDAAGSGPWRAEVRVASGSMTLTEVIDVPLGSTTLVGAPAIFRAGASLRAEFAPAAASQFRRTERLRVAWPVVAGLEHRAARVLDRRGQALPIVPAVADASDAPGGALVVVDLTLSSFAEGDYVLELAAERGATAERQMVAFRIVR